MRNAPHPNPCSGFSLVDIMVGMVIGLLTMIVIMQSYAAFEGQKRTTTTGMEAQENGLIALHALETDIRQAGYGLIAPGSPRGSLVCNGINTYNAGVSTLNVRLMPVLIIDGGTDSDTITATYSTSATGGTPALLKDDVDESKKDLEVKSSIGFTVGDKVLVGTPGSGLPCSRLVITTITGGDKLKHKSGEAGNPLNPPDADNIFPAGGYETDLKSVVFNMGAMAQNQYQALCSSLTSTNLTTTAGVPACTSSSAFTAGTTPLASNIVSIQAQYGIAPAGSQVVDCWVHATNNVGNSCDASNWAAPAAANVARIKALRVAVVARSSLMERTTAGACTATVTAPNWYGGAINLTGIPSWQCYRYKVYQTIIPLRNVLWANL